MRDVSISVFFLLLAAWHVAIADESDESSIVDVPVAITVVRGVDLTGYEPRSPCVEREEAELLPIDYRVLVRVAVEDFAGSPAEPSVVHVFLTVFETDPDAAMMKKLAEYGDAVRPSSEIAEHVHLDDEVSDYHLKVLATLPTEHGTYVVELFYDCGGLMCQSAWQIEVAERDSGFVVVGTKLHWIS